MSGCDDVNEDGANVVNTTRRKTLKMKKIMSLMIGMSLVIGAATLAFADDTKKDTKKSDDTKKKKKKKSDDKPKS
jgi:uncharacterized metal-binding protein